MWIKIILLLLPEYNTNKTVGGERKDHDIKNNDDDEDINNEKRGYSVIVSRGTALYKVTK